MNYASDHYYHLSKKRTESILLDRRTTDQLIDAAHTLAETIMSGIHNKNWREADLANQIKHDVDDGCLVEAIESILEVTERMNELNR
jgi:ribosome-binding protein aMBF1 (putative translation factor)